MLVLLRSSPKSTSTFELEAAAALKEPTIESLLTGASRISTQSSCFLQMLISKLLLAPSQVSQCDDERRRTGFVSMVLAAARSIHGEILSLRGDTSMALAAQIRIGPEVGPELLETRRRLAKMADERADAPVQSVVGQRRQRTERRERRERRKAARTE